MRHAIFIGTFLLSLSLSVFTQAVEPNQSWTLRDGKKIEGTIHMVRHQRVQLQMAGGRKIGLDINGFSSASQNNIKNWVRGQGGNLEFASWIKSPESAFSKNWPRTVYGPASPVVRSVLEESKLGHYVFESEHYRFVSDEKLDGLLVQKFATLFETTYKYNMALPLNVPGKYRSKKHKFTIYLVGKYETYLSMGGAAGSAGIYISRNKTILVPMVALGAYKTGKKWAHHRGGENMVIAHEITHQLMEGELTAPWYIEGSAEYIAATPYTHAAYHVYGSKPLIFSYVTSKKSSKSLISRRLGSRVAMPKLQHFMNMPYAQFTSRKDANQNYGIALLLTYYFYHIDGSGNAHHIKNYIKALQRGKTETQAQAALLNGRSYENLQKSFAKFCAKNGLAIDFR